MSDRTLPLLDLDDRGLLGRGGMGEVRRVWDPTLGRALACKATHPGASSQLEPRLLREARLAAGLAHPGVVPYTSSGGSQTGAPASRWRRCTAARSRR